MFRNNHGWHEDMLVPEGKSISMVTVQSLGCGIVAGSLVLEKSQGAMNRCQ